MKNHTSPEIIDLFDKDVNAGKIELVSDFYLKDIGMYNVFQQHVRDIRILFDSGDLGEVYAVALAKTLGCMCVVTDDIKERGPHYTLMRIPDSDVMPFAFYEILFLDYLDGEITEEELSDYFYTICDLSGMPMDLSSKLKSFIRRFWSNPYREIEKDWMTSYCTDKKIDPKLKLQKLISYLNYHDQGSDVR